MAEKPTDFECLEVLIHLEDKMWDSDSWVLQGWISSSVKQAPAMRHLGRSGVPRILRHLETEGYVERKPRIAATKWRPSIRGLTAIRTLTYPTRT